MDLYQVLAVLACVIAFILVVRKLRKPKYAYAYNCNWKYSSDPEFCYHTDCGEAFQFLTGKLKDNRFTYCPYCSRSVHEIY